MKILVNIVGNFGIKLGTHKKHGEHEFLSSLFIDFITTTFNATLIVFMNIKKPKILVVQSYVQYHHKK